MMKKLIIIPILILCLVTFVSAYLYDDFSNEELDQNKWSASGNMDEYYVENGVFHTAQNSGADRYTNLMMVNQEFTTGDVVEYDLVYERGSGNRMSNIIIDNIELNHYAILVGYWNEVQQSGNDFGTYHFRVEFVENTVNVFVTKPNGETVQINIGNPQINGNIHTFGVGTRTGHNGIVEMDFDNFELNSDEVEENNFEERITSLEEQVEELNERVEDLETSQEDLTNKTSFLETTVNSLQETLNGFMEKINNYFKFLPRETKEGIVCNYMRENRLSSYEDLGLSCTIRNRGNFWWLRGGCSCR